MLLKLVNVFFSFYSCIFSFFAHFIYICNNCFCELILTLIIEITEKDCIRIQSYLSLYISNGMLEMVKKSQRH